MPDALWLASSADPAALVRRIHAYEGRTMEEVVRNVRAMALWGVQRVVLTNAAGAVNPELQVGQLMASKTTSTSWDATYLQVRTSTFGPRFPDMTTAYDPVLRKQALALGRHLGIDVAKESTSLQLALPTKRRQRSKHSDAWEHKQWECRRSPSALLSTT